MRKKKDIDKTIVDFLETYPLYTKFEISNHIDSVDLGNVRLNLFCKVENKLQTFKLDITSEEAIYKSGRGHMTQTIPSDGMIEEKDIDFVENYVGLCQSCENYKVNIIINGFTQKSKDTAKKFYLRKIGQLPAPEIQVAKEISDFLNEENNIFYNKALKNLEFGYGIGAYAYLRRILENEIEKICQAISKLDNPNSEKITEAILAYKKTKQKSKLIEEITPFLPHSLKDQGTNILQLLYAATSVGLHELSEEECIEKAKHIDTLFKFLIKKINEEKNDMTSVRNAIKKLK